MAIPSTLLVIGVLVGADLEGLDRSTLIRWWAPSLLLFVVGGTFGMRLVRSGRSIALFLRRFSDREAIDAFTRAASGAVGTSWRIVTLDDSSIRPVDADETVSHAAGMVSGTAHAISLLMTAVQRLAPIAIALMWISAAWAYVVTQDLDGILDVTVQILSGRVPSQSFGLDPIGVFAVMATLAGVALVAAFVLIGVTFLAVPFGGILSLASRVREASARSATEKAQRISSPADIELAARNVERRSSRVISPRLFVLRVADPMWQQAVESFVHIARAVLIDVSAPSANLVWELEHVLGDTATVAILTCHRDQVHNLEQLLDDGRLPGLASMLEGVPILGYDVDRRGMRRFTRSLRNRLLTIDRERPRRRVA